MRVIHVGLNRRAVTNLRLNLGSAELGNESVPLEASGAALVEVADDFGGLLLRQVVAKVDHRPSEVVLVDLFRVDRREAGAHRLGGVLLLKEFADVCEQLADVELLELGDGGVVDRAGSRFKDPHVLVVLDPGRNVHSDVALLLELDVLGLVEGREVVGHHFELAAEVVLLDDGVRREVVVGLAVADQNWLAGLHGLALALEAVVGVAAVDHPLGVVGVARVHGGLLQSGDGGENVHAVGGGAESEALLVQVLVRLNFDFLTETDNAVAAENVCCLHARHLEDVAGHGALVHVARVQTVRLVNVVLTNAQVADELTLSFLITEANGVA